MTYVMGAVDKTCLLTCVDWFGSELACRSFRHWFSAVDREKHCPSAARPVGIEGLK
jgi:hypothetical protein